MTSVRLLSSRCTVRRLCNLAEPGATWHVAVTLAQSILAPYAFIWPALLKQPAGEILSEEGGHSVGWSDGGHGCVQPSPAGAAGAPFNEQARALPARVALEPFFAAAAGFTEESPDSSAFQGVLERVALEVFRGDTLLQVRGDAEPYALI